MLTTYDNDFDPFTQFTEWYLEDLRLGYNCCGKLARIAKTSEHLLDWENDVEIDRAMNFIVDLCPQLFVKVEASDYPEKFKSMQEKMLPLIEKAKEQA